MHLVRVGVELVGKGRELPVRRRVFTRSAILTSRSSADTSMEDNSGEIVGLLSCSGEATWREPAYTGDGINCGRKKRKQTGIGQHKK